MVTKTRYYFSTNYVPIEVRMHNSKVKYIKTLAELEIDNSNDTDYVIKSTYPLDYSVYTQLFHIEENVEHILDYVFLEFDSISGISGEQILNMCNNLNVNILIKEPTSPQIQSMLIKYSNTAMFKTVYPAKIIVLLALMFIYSKTYFSLDVDIEDFIKEELDRINYTYISEKYDLKFLTKWTKWYITYLVNHKKEFVTNFRSHCFYLCNEAVSYHLEDKPKEESTINTKLYSGLYVPLAFIMKEYKYNPYREDSIVNRDFNYLAGHGRALAIKALEPISNYVIAVKDYVDSGESRQEMFIDSLSNLTDQIVLECLKGNFAIRTDDPTTERDLFPLEIRCVKCS